MPEETFWSQVAPAAREVCQKQFGTSLLVTAMLAYTNICKNQCLYCGMRAGNKIPRYRMSPEEILPLAQRAREDGLGRMFLLAGSRGIPLRWEPGNSLGPNTRNFTMPV